MLSLFFIDEVAKYRQYDDDGEKPGAYARIFEEEYALQLNEELELEDTPYQRYLKDIDPAHTHNGYFSIDKKTKRLVDPTVAKKGEEAGTTTDVDAYDLILRDKETLLSLPDSKDDAETRARKQVRFIFSHSALREGWDNPNVFVICTLKHSDSTISRRQEVGRGMRLCVNQYGERMDNPDAANEPFTERRAEVARKLAVLSTFVTAASLLVGAVAAFLAAGNGGDHRDKGANVRFFNLRRPVRGAVVTPKSPIA